MLCIGRHRKGEIHFRVLTQLGANTPLRHWREEEVYGDIERGALLEETQDTVIQFAAVEMLPGRNGKRKPFKVATSQEARMLWHQNSCFQMSN